jgi:hypothetical protein
VLFFLLLEEEEAEEAEGFRRDESLERGWVLVVWLRGANLFRNPIIDTSHLVLVSVH